MSLQITEKIPNKSHLYRRLGCGATNSKKFAGSYIQLLKYKNQVRAVLFENKNDKEFHTLQIVSPSEARVMIGWLARYIALSDPDPVSLAIAETKAHANGVLRNQNQIAKELGLP